MKRSDDLPHGNPVCGAKNRKGGTCTAFSMKNGRCRFHGGLSTGPKTETGKLRSRRGNWKHGLRSAEAIGSSRDVSELIRKCRKLMSGISD